MLWQLHCSRIATVPSFVTNFPEPAAMTTEISDVNPYEELGLLSDEAEAISEEGPRCARCGRIKLREWINWQKCWSVPGTGADGNLYVLVYPIEKHPMMFRIQGQGAFGDTDFWWFFVCVQCRLFFRRRGLIIDHSEIEDRFCAGANGEGPRLRPTFVPKNVGRDQILDGPYGVGDFWIRPPSPASSESSDPWRGPF